MVGQEVGGRERMVRQEARVNGRAGSRIDGRGRSESEQ
jgi:hypothetical protein